MLDDLPTRSTIASLRRRLSTWSRNNKRQLPWRAEPDPYKVWVSEIMLQQTTVVAVIPYFERFLKSFPTVMHLAQADEKVVLKAWEGLGYYSRARNMHRAAQKIVDNHAGAFPRSVDELTDLPGIGRYTAGAIVSFAYGVAAPIVEANTLRLYSRLLGFEGDPHSSQGQRLLWAFAERIVPRKKPGEFNQALMDLGATICRPVAPDCMACPLRDCCQAWLTDKVDAIPRPKQRPAITNLIDVCVIPRLARRRDALLLRRYAHQERWAGLWDFPRVNLLEGDAADSTVPVESRQVVEAFRSKLNIEVKHLRLFHELKHTVTRYRIQLLCFNATIAAVDTRQLPGEWQQFMLDELDDLPLTATARRIARVMHSRGLKG